MILQRNGVNLRLPPGAKLYEPKPKWPGEFEPLKPELTIAQILAWADAFRAQRGCGRRGNPAASPRSRARTGTRFRRRFTLGFEDCLVIVRWRGFLPRSAECGTR